DGTQGVVAVRAVRHHFPVDLVQGLVRLQRHHAEAGGVGADESGVVVEAVLAAVIPDVIAGEGDAGGVGRTAQGLLGGDVLAESVVVDGNRAFGVEELEYLPLHGRQRHAGAVPDYRAGTDTGRERDAKVVGLGRVAVVEVAYLVVDEGAEIGHAGVVLVQPQPGRRNRPAQNPQA